MAAHKVLNHLRVVRNGENPESPAEWHAPIRSH